MSDEAKATPKRRGRPPGTPNSTPRPAWGPGNKQGERAVMIAVQVKPKLRELLITAATDQFRTLPGQAAKYIVDGLVRDGYITPSKTEEV